MDTQMKILNGYWIAVLIVTWISGQGDALNLDTCVMALGMETGEIEDNSLTASSQHTPTVSAQNGRIRGGSAWCPEGSVSRDSHEYLQINFDDMKVITNVETQGRFGNGMGQEYADQYKLEYQRESEGEWFTFKNRRGSEVFTGNMNTYGSEMREIDPPIITKRLRFVPYSDSTRTVCMRVEVYGCPWHDRLVWYNIPQGETRDSEMDLHDYIYDGHENNGALTGGLGQLTDGESGESNFRIADEDFNIKGYEWIGWKNESFPAGKPLEMVFKFDTVRNFTSMRFFINNMYSRDVRVFKHAVVYTSTGGEYYTDPPIHFNYMRDSIMKYARSVIISLNHRVGQYIKVKLYFDSMWMMISEVEFDSRGAAGVFPVELPPSTTPPAPTSGSTQPAGALPPAVSSAGSDGADGGAGALPPIVVDNGGGEVDDDKQSSDNTGSGNKKDEDDGKSNDKNENNVDELPVNDNSVIVPDSDKRDGNGEYDSDNGGPIGGGGTDNPHSTSSTVVEADGLKEEHIGIIIGAIIAFIVILFFLILFIIMKSKKRKNRHHRTYLPAQNSTFEDLRTGGTLKSSKSSNGNLYNFVATSDVDSERGGGITSCCVNNVNASSVYGDINDGSVHRRNYPDFPKTPDSTLNSSNRDYAVPDIMQSAVLPNGTSFIYSPNAHVGTISGSICHAPLPNLPTGANTSSNRYPNTGHNNKIVLIGGANAPQPPPRLPIPPPPPTNQPPSSSMAAPYASSDLVTLQANKSMLPGGGHKHCGLTASRSGTPVGVINPVVIQSCGGLPPSVSTQPTSSTSSFMQSLPRAVSSTGTLHNMQGCAGNNVYSLPTPGHAPGDDMWAEELAVMEFPRESLKFIEKIGEGQFGEVHLCLAQNLEDLLGGDFLVNRTSASQDMLVAVKMLRPSAEQQARENFKQEAKIMTRLKDTNIVQVLGVCSRGDPLCVIVEYMKDGDLHQYLQRCTLEGTKTLRKNLKTLSYGCLIYMATQVASGMKYLETQNLVHRDLAARNCLVGNLKTIKITDFGMSRGLYSCDYYKIEGRAMLPIRWMAWESVILGKFSSKSDVWSFAVTLWEILNFAREQPFGTCSDEVVIENCTHYYQADGEEMYLPLPKYCPKEIYDLMCECWHPEETLRPSFREIHMFLQRKNMGYDPRDECPDDGAGPVVMAREDGGGGGGYDIV